MSARDRVGRAARRAVARRRAGLPAFGVGPGQARRLVPVDRHYGFDRGTPVDRVYIERFLRQHGAYGGYNEGDLRGRVMEVGGSEYARAFSAPSGIDRLDVLHADNSNPEATIVGDLETGAGIPEDAFDCIICTQTLHVLFEIAAAVETLHRSLRPGGVALATFPGLTARCKPDDHRWGDYWRLTPLSARRLFEAHFPAERVRVESFGNLRSATAFLHGLAAHELSAAELELDDPDYPVVIAVRAVKAG